MKKFLYIIQRIFNKQNVRRDSQNELLQETRPLIQLGHDTTQTNHSSAPKSLYPLHMQRCRGNLSCTVCPEDTFTSIQRPMLGKYCYVLSFYNAWFYPHRMKSITFGSFRPPRSPNITWPSSLSSSFIMSASDLRFWRALKPQIYRHIMKSM